MKQNKKIIKSYFETGDRPTQENYVDLIDSYIDAKQSKGESNRRFVIDEHGNVSVASGVGEVNGDLVTVGTSQEITGIKTIKAPLFTERIQSNSGISAAGDITAGDSILVGGNALHFTESGNSGSATINADISGSTKHILQAKSGTIAHLSDIPESISVLKRAKVFISATALESGGSQTIIPAQGKDTVLDIISVHSIFNFKGDNYGDAYLLFNHGVAAISLSDINSSNYIVKTSQGSQETRGIPVNTSFNATSEGSIESGNDGVTIYVTYRIITTDGYQVI